MKLNLMIINSDTIIFEMFDISHNLKKNPIYSYNKIEVKFK